MSGSRASVLAVIALALWGLKRHYADADVEDLRWILWPTGRLVGLATGSSFEFEGGAGYICRRRLFLIEKSCAGVNFMIAALGMTGLAFVRAGGRGAAMVWRLGQGALLSYAATVLVNSLRILVALWLASANLGAGWWTAARIHRLEGIVVYFAGLLVLDRVARGLAPGAGARGSGVTP